MIFLFSLFCARLNIFLPRLSAHNSLFKWHDSHFILENRLETFAVDDLFLYQADTSTSGNGPSGKTGSSSTSGTGPSSSSSSSGTADTLLMIVAYGRQANRKTKVNVYHVVNGKVEMLQHMYFQVNVVHPFTVGYEHYMLECSKRRKSLSS